MRWIGRIAVVLVVLLGSAFLFREALILKAINVAMQIRIPVGEHHEVTWSGTPLGSPEAPREDGPPNIILIVADDLGWNDLSWHGGGLAGGTVPTPNIDALALGGANFINGYSANGTCAPSRASLMSGRYSTRFGFEFTPTPDGMLRTITRLDRQPPGSPETLTNFEEESESSFEEQGMPPSEVTVAEALAEAGYYTAHIGKWHLGRNVGMMPHEQGFNDSLLMHSGMYLPVNSPDVVNSRQEFDPIDRFLWAGMLYASSFNGSDAFEPRGYITDYYTEEAVRVIEQNRHRPFFLYLAHWAPHTPPQATREDYDALSHIDDHRLRTYAAMVRALDRGVGEVMAALEANGIADNTLVIFTSDNGGAGYVGLPEINEPFRGWKITFFEGGIHVPYFMHWPARISAGTVIEEPVHHFDIYATAVDAAGSTMPEDRIMDGVSLLPYAIGTDIADPAPVHDQLVWRGAGYQVILSGGWKLQRDETQGRVWLFDMANDPTEQVNLADQHPERVARLIARLDAHNAEQMVSPWPSRITTPIRIDQTLDERWNDGDEYIYWSN